MSVASSLNLPSTGRSLPPAVFTDLSTLNALRGETVSVSGEQGGETQLKEAARQFSSIFLHMALKSMRDASFGGGLLDSQQSEFYRDMFDQQLALDLSEGEGFGLTQLIVDQLSQHVGPSPTGDNKTPLISAGQATEAYSRTAQYTLQNSLQPSAQESGLTADSSINHD